jgi:hypothetical protein
VDVDIPLTDDSDLSDGIFHVTPYVTLFKVLKPWLQVYTQVGVNFFVGEVTQEDLDEERTELDQTYVQLAPGVIFPLRPVSYVLDVDWRTTGDNHAVLITPAMRWDALPWLSFDIGPRFGLVDADGIDVQLSVRFSFGPALEQAKTILDRGRPRDAVRPLDGLMADPPWRR